MKIPLIYVGRNETEFIAMVFDDSGKNQSGQSQLECTYANIFSQYAPAVSALREQTQGQGHSVVVPTGLKTLRGDEAKLYLKKSNSAYENGDKTGHYELGDTIFKAFLVTSIAHQFNDAQHILPESVCTIHGLRKAASDIIFGQNSDVTALVHFSDEFVELHAFDWRGDFLFSDRSYYGNEESAKAAINGILSDSAGKFRENRSLTAVVVSGHCPFVPMYDVSLYDSIRDEKTVIHIFSPERAYSVRFGELTAQKEIQQALERVHGRLGQNGIPLVGAFAAQSIKDNHGADLQQRLSSRQSEKTQGTLSGRLQKFTFPGVAALTNVTNKSQVLAALILAVVIGGGLYGILKIRAITAVSSLQTKIKVEEQKKKELADIEKQCQVVIAVKDWLKKRLAAMADISVSQKAPYLALKAVFDAIPYEGTQALAVPTKIIIEGRQVTIEGYTDVMKAIASAQPPKNNQPAGQSPDQPVLQTPIGGNLIDPVKRFQSGLEASGTFSKVNINFANEAEGKARYQIVCVYYQEIKTDAFEPLPVPNLVLTAAGSTQSPGTQTPPAQK